MLLLRLGRSAGDTPAGLRAGVWESAGAALPTGLAGLTIPLGRERAAWFATAHRKEELVCAHVRLLRGPVGRPSGRSARLGRPAYLQSTALSIGCGYPQGRGYRCGRESVRSMAITEVQLGLADWLFEYDASLRLLIPAIQQHVLPRSLAAELVDGQLRLRDRAQRLTEPLRELAARQYGASALLQGGPTEWHDRQLAEMGYRLRFERLHPRGEAAALREAA